MNLVFFIYFAKGWVRGINYMRESMNLDLFDPESPDERRYLYAAFMQSNVIACQDLIAMLGDMDEVWKVAEADVLKDIG